MNGRIICGDSRRDIPDEPVHLVVTSPPYNVGIEYDSHEDTMPLGDWYELVEDVLTAAWDRMVPGARMAVNILESAGRNPAIPLGAHIQRMVQGFDGAFYRGSIIWDKGPSAGVTTAWGTWGSARNPVLRGVFEMIYVWSKGQAHLDGEGPAIPSEEFTKATLNVWQVVATNNRVTTGRRGEEFSHPAPFPIELARRLVTLYSFPGQTVLDPFFGAGTTGLAAAELGRRFIGVELSPEYCERAARRIAPFEGMEPPIEVAVR